MSGGSSLLGEEASVGGWFCAGSLAFAVSATGGAGAYADCGVGAGAGEVGVAGATAVGAIATVCGALRESRAVNPITIKADKMPTPKRAKPKIAMAHSAESISREAPKRLFE